MKMIPEILINQQVSIPVLGLGTWEMGGRQQADKTDDKKWIDAISMSIENGIRHIDTAAMYGGGHTETIVGQAIQNFNREELFITTKVSGDRLQFSEVLRSADASRKRLKIDQIDLFLLHWPNPAIPLSQTMSAINKLIDDSSIKHFGLSNFPVDLIKEVRFYTDAPIITNQVEYNLFTRNNGSYNRNVESEIIPYCLKNGIGITAWRPVLKGDHAKLQKPLIQDLCKKYNKTPFQIALNWLISKPSMIAIPKMSTPGHLQENLAATQFKMEENDLQLLDNIMES